MVHRRVSLAVVIAALVAGCGDDGGRRILDERAACQAVKDDLTADEVKDRFGDPDDEQDFFGDEILTYRRAEVEWKFQVSGQQGTFRALRQPKGEIEEILPCGG
jgi:hypothetical protein